MMDLQQARALREPFPPSAIGKLPKGGALLDYVGHAAITDRLLQVDPEWSWEPFATDENGLPALDRAGNLWIRLTICGHTRIGVGDGKSAKEVIGDALRNGAMRFGVGLDLWAKEDLHEISHPRMEQESYGGPDTDPPDPSAGAPIGGGPKSPPPISEAQLRKIHASFSDLGITDRDQRLAIASLAISRDIGSSKELTKSEASILIEALAARAAPVPEHAANP